MNFISCINFEFLKKINFQYKTITLLSCLLSFSYLGYSQEIDITQNTSQIPDGGSYNFGNVIAGNIATANFIITNSSTSADLNVVTP